MAKNPDKLGISTQYEAPVVLLKKWVDFHWEVDGRMYEFSLPGGGFISFSDLIEVLGVAKTGENEEKEAENDDVYLAGEVPGINDQDENGENNTENTSYSGIHNPMEVSGIDNQDINGKNRDELAREVENSGIRDNIQVSEDTWEFVADVESVVFSNPALVDVSKAESETTVGGIKESRGLECQYSAELTKEQIETINSTEVESGDWALISMLPFSSEEELTVTMKDGERFTVKVTDAQITKDFIAAKDGTYTITVIYDDEAGIPYDADLKVREIEAGTEEYQGYLSDSATKLGVERDDVSFARFFDIGIVDKNGDKVEPKTAVQVKIEYKEAMEIGDGQMLNIVHFADTGTETISDVSVSADNTEITYQQDSFSVTGTLITTAPESGKQYAVVVKKDGKYFSVLNDGTLQEITSAYNPSTNKIDVDLQYPLVWTYEENPLSQDHIGNLRVPSSASGFNEYNNLPTGYYYRYITPNEGTAIKEEDADHPDELRWSGDIVTIVYENNMIHSYREYSGNYIGVSDDGSRIVGLKTQANAAEIHLAEISAANPGSETHDDHVVNHIDIAIAGASSMKFPMAYGDYYDESGNIIYTSSETNHNLSLTPDIDLTIQDMKNASITATAIENGERVDLDDVFYITGYSQNHETGNELAQVRIEGSFKVSNIPHADNADNNSEVCQARKDHPIDYSITVVKTVEVPAQYNNQQLYIMDNGVLKPLKFEVPISLTASFNYWDEGNKCPPLHIGFDETQGFVQDWIDGKIVGNGYDMSGMDFELGATATGSTVPAIEIKKIIQKEDGSYLETDDIHTVDIDVYYKTKNDGEEDDLVDVAVNEPVDENTLDSLTGGYARQHTKTITVGEDAVGAIYDYDVDEGLFVCPAKGMTFNGWKSRPVSRNPGTGSNSPSAFW